MWVVFPLRHCLEAQSFIKIYCAYLDLDPKEFTGQDKQYPQKPVLNAAVGRDLGERPEKRRSFIQEASVKVSSIKPAPKINKLIGFILLAIVLLIFIPRSIRFFSAKKAAALSVTRPAQNAPSADTLSSGKAKTKGITAASARKKPLLPQGRTQKEAFPGFIVGILAKEKCWVVVKTDGRTAFQGMLPKGRFENWKAKEKVELTLGDAAAVELQVNDQRFTNLGRRGQPLKNILINKEGLKISR